MTIRRLLISTLASFSCGPVVSVVDGGSLPIVEIDAGDDAGIDAGLDAGVDAGVDAGTPDAGCVATDLEGQLRCLPGLSVTRLGASLGFTRYQLQLVQPVDHTRPDAGTFSQRATLSVSNVDKPMVLVTSGYFLIDRQQELSRVYFANQLNYEYRYFGTSKPAVIDWSTNTLKQAADDAHHFVTLLKPLFPKKWVGAGLSKGGVTALAHRQHYPNDVDATVAYGAPYSTSRADPRAAQFLGNSIGGATWAACRASLAAFQRELLMRKAEVLPLIRGTFTRLPLPIAYEYTVVDFGFSFWMFTAPANQTKGCSAISPAGAPAAALHDFVQLHTRWDDFADDGLATFQAYYASTATELGGPAAYDDHLATLLTPGQYEAGSAALLPPGIPADQFVYRPEVQQSLTDFVVNRLTRAVFVYGEFDPWTSQGYTALNAGNASLLTPGGQHTAIISDGVPSQRMPVWTELDGWLEATAVAPRSLIRPEDAWHVVSDEERRFSHRLR